LEEKSRLETEKEALEVAAKPRSAGWFGRRK